MAQKLILFEDIIDSAAMKSNKTLMAELEKLAEYVFGEEGFSIEKAGNKADDIQIWSGDELYKAIANGYCTAFRFKSAFEIQMDGYAGPVMAWFFEPDGAFDDQIVVLTCESDGLFKNPRYVCGLLISEFDLERLLGDLGGDAQDDVDDDDNVAYGEDSEDEAEEKETAQKEELKPDVTAKEEAEPAPETKPEPVPAPETKPEVVAKADDNDNDKGDIILRLVSYSGSVIKMMTTLSGIDGIDEEKAFDILQKLPSVVREGISAKAAMKIGSILEEAGATIELARASDSVVETESPKPEPEKHKSSPKHKSAPKPKPAEPERSPMEYVDLGLSVKWAKWNLGASAPEEIGDYFAWGETGPKTEYKIDNYRFSERGKMIKYNTKDTYGSVVDNLKQLDLPDDAAHHILGGDWRMPTAKEFEELIENCTLSYTNINGVKGLKYRSKKKGYTDRWIFIPYTGMKSNETLSFADRCCYWTSTLYTRRPDSSKIGIMIPVYEDKVERDFGLCIRPVTK